jgi:hypothetical protein
VGQLMLSREGMSAYRGRIAIVPLCPFSSEATSVTSALSDAEAGLPPNFKRLKTATVHVLSRRWQASGAPGASLEAWLLGLISRIGFHIRGRARLQFWGRRSAKKKFRPVFNDLRNNATSPFAAPNEDGGWLGLFKMPRKALDSRIPALIRNGVQEKKRTFMVVVGDRAKDVVVHLHYIMSSVDIKQNKSVLWAYKKDLLGFTSHRKKRETKIRKEVKRGIREANTADPFELFVTLNNIRYVYYKETEKILGNTFGMCVLQDFEAITPNLLARTIETVEGGGLVVLLLKGMKSLKQLYTMSMDVHSRYRTEAHDDVTARFNERFILSLGSCESCLVVDDELNVLPISG